MKRFLLFLCLAGGLLAQCPTQGIQFNFAGGNGGVQLDDRTAGCVTFLVTYQADSGLSGYTVEFDYTTGLQAPDTSSWASYPGTTVASTASFGTAASGLATFSNIDTTGTTVNTPWLRVLSSGASGTGNIRGVLYGFPLGSTGGTGGGGGSGGTGCPNPCPVLGSVAPGAAAANPVTTGTRDDLGNVAADYRFPDQADVSGSAVTGIKIVSGVAAKLIYVGHLSVSLAAGTTVSVIEGTGTLCATSSATIAGPYQNAVAIALDFTRDDPLKTATTGDDLCLSFGGSSTGGGFVKYAQR